MSPPPTRLLHETLLLSAAQYPEKPVVVAEGTPHSYAELLDASLRLAGWLRTQGLGRGDRVAIFMDNTWPCVVSIYAALIAGGVFVIVNPQTKADKLEYILKDSEAAFLLTDGHLSKAFVPAVAASSALRGVVCAGKLPTDNRGIAIAEFAQAISKTSPWTKPSESISIDLAALIYTSGSTGNPKGVMMTHQSMVFTAASLLQYLRLSAQHRILNLLPLAFDYGLYQLLMAVRVGATLVLERSFAYPAQVLARIEQHEVTVFPGVPTVYAMLLSMHRNKPLCFPSVQRVTNTAAALPASAVPGLREIFPNALIFRMYGMTECKRVSYLEPEELDQRPDSVGKAIPGTEVFVLTADGRPAAPGEVGVLHVRGAHVMLGYWKLPDRSAEMLKPGRYPGERMLCTQDHFRMDQDGYLYFVGRSDDIIKTRGEKVSPVEVENALYGIEGIREAAVVGVPDDLLGQAIRAYVALEPGSTLTDKDIKKTCLARLENFMVPRDVIFLPELPKTATGKISKKGLHEAG
jgi:amino acid adenylation domain-containing protein